MTLEKAKESQAKFDLFLCFDRNGIVVKDFLSRESSHIQQEPVLPKAIRRRAFKREEPASPLFGVNSWLVGNAAEAFENVITDLPKTSRALLDKPRLFRSESEEDAIWKDGPILIGMVERARNVFARAIDAIGSPKSLILLSSDLAMLGRDGSWEEDPTPPLWLVYALRRYNWPGEVWLKVEAGDRSDPNGKHEFEADGCLQLTPALPARVGAWKTAFMKTNIRKDLSVALQTPSQIKPMIIAPIGSALPVVESVSFVDQDGEDLPLVIRYGSFSSKGQRIIEVKRDKTEGSYSAFVPHEFAPRRCTIPYVVETRVDEWGNVSIAVSTSQGERLPLETGNTPLPLGQTKSDDMFSRLVLERLCFPKAKSFPVASWDAMSINGAPPAKQIAKVERPTLLNRRELIERSRPELEPPDLAQIDRARAVLLQEAEFTDTAALVIIRPTLFERLLSLAHSLFSFLSGQGEDRPSYYEKRVKALISRKRLVCFPDTPDFVESNSQVKDDPEQILKDLCPQSLQTAISDMTQDKRSRPRGLDNT